MTKKILIISFLVAITCPLLAQTSDYNNLVFIELNSGTSIISNSFTNTWDPSPSLHFNVQMPFYGIPLEGGIRYMQFRGNAPSQTNSDFQSVFLHVGGGYPLQITKRYTISPGIRFGANFMIFDEAEVFTQGPHRFVTDTREAEFSYEFVLQNDFKIAGPWYARASVSYNRTLTEFPLPVTMVSLGISYSFDQPEWLKNFIR